MTWNSLSRLRKPSTSISAALSIIVLSKVSSSRAETVLLETCTGFNCSNGYYYYRRPSLPSLIAGSIVFFVGLCVVVWAVLRYRRRPGQVQKVYVTDAEAHANMMQQTTYSSFRGPQTPGQIHMQIPNAPYATQPQSAPPNQTWMPAPQNGVSAPMPKGNGRPLSTYGRPLSTYGPPSTSFSTQAPAYRS
ncbi:hypothetical protein C8J56DRAFT_288293 [Mycena floridula]|nr:hypothetical protein C8J56DRAFT_288293 [Mycena floridula]